MDTRNLSGVTAPGIGGGDGGQSALIDDQPIMDSRADLAF